MAIPAVTRRTFTRSLALGAAAAALPGGALQAFAGKRLKVGHTGITWGFKPTDAEQAITDVGSLGFAGYESFGNVLEFWDKQGGLKRLLDAAQVPLRSAYCPVNLTETAVRKDEVAKLLRWGQLIKKCGGSVAVIPRTNSTTSPANLSGRSICAKCPHPSITRSSATTTSTTDT